MRSIRYLLTPLGLALAGMLMGAGATLAFEGENHKHVEGMDVYLGIIPAELVQGRLDAKESSMHGGVRRGSNRYHLVVALFDGKTRTRVTDAEVTAQVIESGLASAPQKLEPMKVGDAMTYGNWFVLPASTAYRIRVRWNVPGKAASETEFELGDSGR